jgi:hypothetical protein
MADRLTKRTPVTDRTSRFDVAQKRCAVGRSKFRMIGCLLFGSEVG